MVNICYDYGGDSDVDYKAIKSVVSECDIHNKGISLIFIWQKLSVCDETKYLGHFITDQMSLNSVSWFDFLFGNYHPSKMYFSVNF